MGFASSWNPICLQCRPPGVAASPFPATTTTSPNPPRHAGLGSNGPGYLPTPSLYLLYLKPLAGKLRSWLPWATVTVATVVSKVACAFAGQSRETCLWSSMSCNSTIRGDIGVRWSTDWRTRVWLWTWSCGVSFKRVWGQTKVKTHSVLWAN